jgi:hypothetical protein
MRTPLSLGRRASYPWAFLVVVILAGALLYAWKRDGLGADLILSTLGGIAAFFHFLYSQHNVNTDRFISLFKEFNSRFDKLNDDLNRIGERSSGEVLSASDRQNLYDYFNLCAEEYLFYQAGYIDKDVWHSWLEGMAFFARVPEIRRVWEQELRHGSYYGFNLGLLPSAA